MIYWFYKKISWWIVNIIGWLFSRTAATQLVLPTSAAGSDVSVVIKHEIQFVLGIFNRHSCSRECMICSWSYRFG